MIVPTDGRTLSSISWQLLEAFDPDLICAYRTTGADLKLREPAEYVKLLDQQLKTSFPDEPPDESCRRRWDDALSASPLDNWSIDPVLEKQLKLRLAPFHFEDRVVDNWFTAGNIPNDPLTRVETIIAYGDNPGKLITTSIECQGIPPLWVEAETGTSSSSYRERIGAKGIVCGSEIFNHDDIGKLCKVVLEGFGTDARVKPPDTVTCSPFQLTMVGLGLYSKSQERTWELPLIVVVGSTIEDFALYFNLSRMRPFVHWLVPNWLESFQEDREAPTVDSNEIFREPSSHRIHSWPSKD